MFPFFRKGKTPSKPDIPRETKPDLAPRAKPQEKPSAVKAPAAEEPPKTEAAPAQDTSPGIQVQEIEQQLAPEIQQAVMLYANACPGDAAATLNRFILDNPDERLEQPWHLLFDLYEATGQRAQFEELALEFALRLERSPPTWRVEPPKAEQQKTSMYPTFQFAANLDTHDADTLKQFQTECEGSDAVVLDFSQILSPNGDYAAMLLELLHAIQSKGKEIRLIGGDAFIVRLNAARSAAKLDQNGWLLILQLLQLLGKADAFDEVALDYAVHFEMSPPSYTAPKRLAVEEDAGEPVADKSMDTHTFPLHGVLNMGVTGQFGELRQFATPLKRVVIDLKDVPRIDFSAVGLFVDLAMSLTMSGKQVEIVGGNGLVNLLLQMTGVGQFAAIRQEVRK